MISWRARGWEECNEPSGCATLPTRLLFVTEERWMRRSQQERASRENIPAGTCGSYSPPPTLVLVRSPSKSVGPRSRTGQS